MTLTQIHQLNKLPKSIKTGKPLLHFVHANGIPTPTYQVMLDGLARYFTIVSINELGTHPNYPVDNHWQSMTHQVGDSIDDACREHGVSTLVAVGHSLGAMTTLQTLIANPKPISQAVLLDPSLLTARSAFLYHVTKTVDKYIGRIPKFQYHLIDQLTPAQKSKYRKDIFDSPDDAYQALRHKALFASFDERSFQNYIKYGFKPTADGKYTLSIPKSVESAIFRTMPSLYWLKSISPTKPVALIAGQDSDFTKIGSYDDAHKKFDIPVYYVLGSHMFPLEYPEQTADDILNTLIEQLQLECH